MRQTHTLLLLVSLAACSSDTQDTRDPQAAAPAPEQEEVIAEEVPLAVPAPLESRTLEGVQPYTRVGNLILAGQPTQAALATMHEEGLSTVLDFRTAGEQRGFAEPAAIEELGMTYIPLGFGPGVPLSDQVFDEARAVFADFRTSDTNGDLLVHCGSSNRVGAVWLASRVLDEGVNWDEALAEARSAGLRSPQLVTAAEEYVLGAGKRDLGRYKLEIRAKQPEVQGISVDELSTQVGGNDKLVLLDVRGANEYAVSHLQGAKRAATLDEAKAALADFPKDGEIVVYCSIGYRSAELAAELRGAGYSNVKNLEGSIFEWANTGHTVYREGQPTQLVHPYDAEWGKLLNEELRSEIE